MGEQNGRGNESFENSVEFAHQHKSITVCCTLFFPYAVKDFFCVPIFFRIFLPVIVLTVPYTIVYIQFASAKFDINFILVMVA